MHNTPVCLTVLGKDGYNSYGISSGEVKTPFGRVGMRKVKCLSSMGSHIQISRKPNTINLGATRGVAQSLNFRVQNYSSCAQVDPDIRL